MKPIEAVKGSTKRKIKVLVVEDSTVMQELLVHILSADENIEIIGQVRNGLEAIEFVKNKMPDVITMDVNMPAMNGLMATRRIMETRPIPIIIVSDTINPKDVNDTFNALEAGAVTVANKPGAYGTNKYGIYAKELCQKVKLMSEIKLVRRISNITMTGSAAEHRNETVKGIHVGGSEIKKSTKLVVIGASTGGPVVLEKILSSLPKKFRLPVIVVQHISAGFTLGLVEWLNATSSIPVVIAENGTKIVGGKCYIAPDGHHLRIGPGRIISLSDEPPIYNLRPSVSLLFRSVAETFGANSIGILLSGMGRDGADELKIMKDCGALTIAQNKQSSVVFGMPGEAVKINAAKLVLSPEEIISVLTEAAIENTEERGHETRETSKR